MRKPGTLWSRAFLYLDLNAGKSGDAIWTTPRRHKWGDFGKGLRRAFQKSRIPLCNDHLGQHSRITRAQLRTLSDVKIRTFSGNRSSVHLSGATPRKRGTHHLDRLSIRSAIDMPNQRASVLLRVNTAKGNALVTSPGDDPDMWTRASGGLL